MYNPHNRNNCSLFSIPECIWNPYYTGKPDYTVWSVHTWVRENRSLPACHIWIKYSFVPDPRGIMRASVKNIWNRSPRLEIWCQGVLLEGVELDRAKAEIRSRLLRLLGYHSLRDKPITRYRFNYVASFPEGSLEDLDCHHESHDNVNMREFCVERGIHISDKWLRATDDRIDNLVRLPRFEHKLIHFANGDTGFIPFLSNADIISKPNELSEVGGGNIEISSNYRNEVNSCKHWVSAIFGTTQWKELYAMFESTPLSQRGLPNSMQTSTQT